MSPGLLNVASRDYFFLFKFCIFIFKLLNVN